MSQILNLKLSSDELISKPLLGTSSFTRYGTNSFVTGKFGGALQVNGGGGILDETFQIPAGDFTMMFTFKDLSASNSIRRWCGNSHGIASADTILFREQNGNIAIYIGNTWKTVPYDNATFKDGNFHHYALTVAGNIATLYMDGALITSFAITVPPIWGQSIVMGGYYNSYTNEASIGDFDSLIILNEAITNFSNYISYQNGMPLKRK